MGVSKQLRNGAIISYGSVAINIISGLIYVPWMVEAIGKSQYGLYTLANSVITLFLMDFGLSSATGRYLSKYNAEGDREGAEKFLGAIYKLYLVLDIAIFCVLMMVFFQLDSIYKNLTTTELEQFRVVYVISALFSVINFPFVTFNGVLTAYEKFVPLKLADLLYRVLNIAFTAAVLLLGFGLYAVVTVHAVVGILSLIYKFIVIRKTISIKADFSHTEKQYFIEIFSFSFWVTGSSLAMRLVTNITPTILGVVANSEAIAVFGIITSIEGYTYPIVTAVSGFFMPEVARIIADDRTGANLDRLFVGVGRFQMAINGLLVAGFAVVGRHFIHLWMGEGYTQAYTGVLLILVPGLFYSPMQIANTALVVTKKVKLIAMVDVITGILNVALSFPLSKVFGVTGACISICVAYCVRDVLLHIIYGRQLALDMKGFAKECYGRTAVPILLTVALGLVMNHFVPDAGWMVLILKGSLVVVVYLLQIWLFGLREQERSGIARRVKGMLQRR